MNNETRNVKQNVLDLWNKARAAVVRRKSDFSEKLYGSHMRKIMRITYMYHVPR